MSALKTNSELCFKIHYKRFNGLSCTKKQEKYWASRSLKLPKTFGIKELLNLNIEPDFESDICKIYEIEKKILKNNQHERSEFLNFERNFYIKKPPVRN